MGNEITGLVQIRFQRDGKGDDRRLGGLVVRIIADFGKQLAADLVCLAVENDEVNRHVVVQQERTNGVHRHAQRLILGVAENAGGNQREGHRFAMVLLGRVDDGSTGIFVMSLRTMIRGMAHPLDVFPAFRLFLL